MSFKSLQVLLNGPKTLLALVILSTCWFRERSQVVNNPKSLYTVILSKGWPSILYSPIKGDSSLVICIVILFVLHHSDILSVSLWKVVRSSWVLISLSGRSRPWAKGRESRFFVPCPVSFSSFCDFIFSPKIREGPSSLGPSPKSANKPVHFIVVSLQTNWTVLTNYPPVNH